MPTASIKATPSAAICPSVVTVAFGAPVDPEVSLSIATGPAAVGPSGSTGSARRASRRPPGRACSPAASRPSGTTIAETPKRAATASASPGGALPSIGSSAAPTSRQASSSEK
jgi:hypothetical protein